jgi:hypothetical protein
VTSWSKPYVTNISGKNGVRLTEAGFDYLFGNS